MHVSSQEDLRKARRGDREAIARLIALNELRLARLAELRMGSDLRGKVRVSDVLQSTYLDVLMYIDEFHGSSAADFTAWVVRILENNIRDKGKYFGALKRSGAEAALDDRLAFVTMSSPEPSPSHEAVLHEDFRLFNHALGNLSESYRRIITLRLIQGRDFEEASAILGRTIRATRSLLARARAALVIEYNRLRAQRSSTVSASG